MKSALILVTGLLTSFTAMATPNCSYVLDQDSYWEDASGTLIVNGRKYNCKTISIGREGDFLTICQDPKKKSMKPEAFDFIINFDGAEANFFVSTGLSSNSIYCAGIASVK